MHLTSSTLFTFLQCEYKFFLNQVIGLFPRSLPDYIHLGTLAHEGLEEYWKTGSRADAARWIHKKVGEVFEAAESVERTERLEIAEATACAMVGNVPWDIEKMTEAEAIFFTDPKDVDISLPDGWVFCGKRDGKYTSGRDVIVRDYKTTSGMSRYTDMLQMKMNFQASFYIFMDTDPAVNGCEFCAIRRPAIRQKKKPPEPMGKFLERIETEYRTRRSHYYGRHTTFRDRKTDPFIVNLQSTVDRLVYCMNHTGAWQRQAPACAGYGSGCEYLPVCTNQHNWEDRYKQCGPDCHPELGIVNGGTNGTDREGKDGGEVEPVRVELLHLRGTKDR